MLVLSRKIGEKIKIGNDIFIKVNAVKGRRVVLLIEAPLSVSILRGELVAPGNGRSTSGGEGSSQIILTRKLKEKIIIGGNVEATVVKIGFGFAKLGIKAPKTVIILRTELKDNPSLSVSMAQSQPSQEETVTLPQDPTIRVA
ncbi:MAG: carbon storage regulator [Candidatus Harrisonbacteria bacterium]|nr:carbon storage regulator [Candidatus Harrisonbacteria bacterium]